MWRPRRLRLLTLMGLLLVLASCGGGGGGSSVDETGSSNWDEMVWDEDDWA